MSDSFEQTYFDVLRAIELAVYSAFQRYSTLTDASVDKALDSLQRLYTAEVRGKAAPKLRLSQPESALADQIKAACDLHLGRDAEVMIGDAQRSLDEIIACLKRIRRSVKQMGKQGGRQAYLEFIRKFFSE